MPVSAPTARRAGSPAPPAAQPAHARISLWLRGTETILALPLAARPILDALEAPVRAEEIAAQLGPDFVAALLAARAVEVLPDAMLRWRPGGHIVQEEDGRDNRLSRPHELMIELTSRCNFACPYCCLGELPTAGTRFDMKPELFDQLVEELVRAPVFRLIVTGGEPLLWESRHAALFGGLSRIRRAGTFVTLFTNGVLLDRYQADVEACFDKLVISLDAITEQEFKAMSGRAGRELERVMRNVERLAGRTNVHVNAVVSRLNAHTVGDLLAWCGEAGVRTLNLTRQFGLGLAADADTGISDEAWDELCADLRSRAGGCQVFLVNRKQSLAQHFPFGPCKVGRAYMVVNYDGSVSPCIGYKSDKVGQVGDRGFAEVWTEGRWAAYRTADALCPVPNQQKFIANYPSEVS